MDYLDYSPLPQREPLDGRQLLQRKLFLLQWGQRVDNVHVRSGKVGLAPQHVGHWLTGNHQCWPSRGTADFTSFPQHKEQTTVRTVALTQGRNLFRTVNGVRRTISKLPRATHRCTTLSWGAQSPPPTPTNAVPPEAPQHQTWLPTTRGVKRLLRCE